MDTKQTEQLLHAWMAMEVCIRGNRLLQDLSMNEMLVCSALYQKPEGMTATELCAHTRLLKSQMNHILTQMELQGMILRERSSTDKRSVCVRLQDRSRYLKEHERVLRIVGAVGKELGAENTNTLTALMEQAARIVGNLKEEI